MHYDLIILGGGSAGLSAAIFAVRKGITVGVFTKDIGGQAASTWEIENYPGVSRIEGPELMQRFHDQAKGFGAEFHYEEVTSLKDIEGVFHVTSTRGEYTADAVILAFGKTPRDLGVPGEDEFKNKGVYTSAAAHRNECADKKVLVIGGGNSAMGSALLLAPIAREVVIVNRTDQFRGEAVLLDALKEHKNVQVLPFSAVVRVHGDGSVSGCDIQNLHTETIEEVSCDVIIVAIGLEIRAGFLEGLVEIDASRQVKVDDHMQTSHPGIFGAGDITQSPYKQIVISAGEGAAAALNAYEYIAKKKGIKSALFDWGFLKK